MFAFNTTFIMRAGTTSIQNLLPAQLMKKRMRRSVLKASPNIRKIRPQRTNVGDTWQVKISRLPILIWDDLWLILGRETSKDHLLAGEWASQGRVICQDYLKRLHFFGCLFIPLIAIFVRFDRRCFQVNKLWPVFSDNNVVPIEISMQDNLIKFFKSFFTLWKIVKITISSLNLFKQESNNSSLSFVNIPEQFQNTRIIVIHKMSIYLYFMRNGCNLKVKSSKLEIARFTI